MSSPVLDLPEVEVTPLQPVEATVAVPGSKSYTNRFLAMAGLSGVPCTLHGALVSEDTVLLARGISAFGHVVADVDKASATIVVEPTGAPMQAPAAPIDVRAAGTPIRLLITMAALAEGRTVLTGTARMQERPMGDLLDALQLLGTDAQAVRGNGSPPVEVVGGGLAGGATRISGLVSSQFTTSLLVNAPCARDGMTIEVVDDMISKPYIDMTVAGMAEWGVAVRRDGYRTFDVAPGQHYTGGDVTIEPDASGMSYFLAAAAVTGGRVTIPGIDRSSAQGDVGLTDALAAMGCTVGFGPEGVSVEGGPLSGIEIDMSSMPDTAPTLAVVAAFATGDTRITGIGNLRVKECDRIDAVSTELRRMGVRVDTTQDTLTVRGGADPRGAHIDTYDDHRIAMAFAVAGLRVPGVVIRDPGCVTKSFPAFWDTLDTLGTGRS